MATELDVRLEDSLNPGNSQAGLALILDGRECASVPAWRVGEQGELRKFHAIHPGPLLLFNLESQAVDVQVGMSEAAEDIARWIEGVFVETVTVSAFSLAVGETRTLAPTKTFVGVKAYAPMEPGHPEGLIQPLGLLLRGPSALIQSAPTIIDLG